jgi:hypothetical protein
MKFHLLDPRVINVKIDDLQRAVYGELLQLLENDDYKKFSFEEDLDLCELILIPIQGNGLGAYMEDLRRSSIYSKHKNKIYIYCTDDNAYPFLPGVYPSTLSKWADCNWTLGGHYISSHIHKHQFKSDEIYSSEFRDRDYLFSFVGSSRTHPIRQRVLKLKHPRAYLFDSNPPADQIPWWERKDSTSLYQNFKEVLIRSRFSLCPRGISPSSIRLFEVMEAGCVPVVISDQLVLPKGPNWSNFLIQIPERNLDRTPTILEELEPKFESMSTLARKAWEDYFSPQSSFHSLMSWIFELHKGLEPMRETIEKKIILESLFNYRLNKNRLRKILGRA